MSIFILMANVGENRYRARFDTADPADDRLAEFLDFAEQASKPALSVTHQCSVIAGPEHPHFKIALEAYGFEYHPPCDDRIVSRTMEMLVAGELLDVALVDDECLRGLLAAAFVTEEDWENRGTCGEIVARTFLSAHFVGFSMDRSQMTPDSVSAYSAFAGGILVAVTQARAEWRA